MRMRNVTRGKAGDLSSFAVTGALSLHSNAVLGKQHATNRNHLRIKFIAIKTKTSSLIKLTGSCTEGVKTIL